MENTLNQESNNNFILKGITLEMVYCPAGSFIMGSPENELGRNSDEIQHQVIISNPFMIGKYPVTQKQYKIIIGQNPSCEENNDGPVEHVSWFDSKTFCELLNSKYKEVLPHDYIFALPTETQWKYACRAETTTALNNGKNLTSEFWYCENLGEIAWYDGNTNRIQPVGLKKPNSWGIFDMIGNANEWCEDWYEDYHKSTIIDPISKINGSYKVFRGGYWGTTAMACRSSYRGRSIPEDKSDSCGFRVALVPID